MLLDEFSQGKHLGMVHFIGFGAARRAVFPMGPDKDSVIQDKDAAYGKIAIVQSLFSLGKGKHHIVLSVHLLR